MGFGAPSATPCLAGFFALRCFSLITIWVTPESWVVKQITSLPHWFYTRILRVPKCFSPQAFSLTPKSAHNLGNKSVVRTKFRVGGHRQYSRRETAKACDARDGRCSRQARILQPDGVVQRSNGAGDDRE